jgi:hypothetical protein
MQVKANQVINAMRLKAWWRFITLQGTRKKKRTNKKKKFKRTCTW